jgi:hypothetical protein
MYTVKFKNGLSMSTSDKKIADSWKSKGYEVTYKEIHYKHWTQIQ